MKYLDLGSRIKRFREQKGITIGELSRRTGLMLPDLEKVENNEDLPSIANLIKISKILEVNVADIFRDRPKQENFEVLRKNDRQDFKASKNRNYSFQPLTFPGGNKHLDAYMVEVPPHQTENMSERLTHPGEEFLYLVEGKLKCQIGNEEIILESGDSLFLRASAPHRYFNPFSEVAKAFSVLYPF